MGSKTWLTFSALLLTLFLAALLFVPQLGTGAQGPEDADRADELELIEVKDVGPPAYTLDEQPAPPDALEGEIGTASHTSGFTYQGRLLDNGQPADGLYDIRSILYDAESDGGQLGSTVLEEDVAVSDGLFTVILDFGSGAFTGGSRYLEIGVRPGDSTDTFAILSPRRALTPTPYATYAYSADQLDGRDASSFASASHDHDDRYYRKQSGTQFTGTLSAGQTSSYFTFGWPTDEIVYWSMHPTTTDGRVDWTVDIRLAGNGRYIYYLTVTNRGSNTTSFSARYILFR